MHYACLKKNDHKFKSKFKNIILAMSTENSQLIAVAIILIGMILIVLVPLFILNPNITIVWNQNAFFIVLFIGFLFIIFLAVLLAIKQKRNIWG